MKEAVTLVVFLAVVACGGLWLLQDGQDGGGPDARPRASTSDYRPGPAWLHRRLGQTGLAAPFRALTHGGAAVNLGVWMPLD